MASAAPYRTSFRVVEDLLAAVRSGRHEPGDFTGVHLAAILSISRPVRVLDFGGSLGLGFARAMRAVPERIKWWRIVDLPDVVEYGRKHFAAGADRLSFHYNIESALGGERADIVTSTGTLQCMADPYGLLADLFALRARYVLIGRLPFEPRERFSVFYTVSGDKIPWRVIERGRLDCIAHGYRLVFEQRLARPPGAEASDEFCMLYELPSSTEE